MKWLEISLSVPPEVAEAVADLLAQMVPQGVALESDPSPTTSDIETLAEPKDVVVRGYMPVDENLEDMRHRLEVGLWHLGQILPIPDPIYHLLEEQDWTEAWKRRYHPILIGKRLLIQPSWLPIEATTRIPLILDPGLAFGTGLHPTTHLCLTILEDYLQPGQFVVDLGCGSGILAIAAGLLGARMVLALDIDPQAVLVARENVIRNGVAGIVRVEQGSLSELVAARTQPQLILANILSSVLETMLSSRLTEIPAPGGTLVLSGILDVQAPSVLSKASAQGWEATEIRTEQEWQAFVLHKEPPAMMAGG